MKLRRILPLTCVTADVKTASKDSVLSELVDLLAKTHHELNQHNAIEVLTKREQLGSTNIGEGVAVPHGTVASISQLMAGFGRSVQGVPFGGLDGKPTHFFFVLLAPEHAMGLHLSILARIANLFRNTTFKESLLSAHSASELYERMMEEDEKFE